MKSPSKLGLALLAAASIPVAPIQAMCITTFQIDGTEGVTSYSVTANGIVMTLSNPVEPSGAFAFGLIGPSNGDLDLSAPGQLVSAFNFTFSKPVHIVNYEVGVIEGLAAGSFTLSAPAAVTSSGNSLTTVGTHTVNGDFEIGANVVGTFAASIPEGTFPTIRSITVSSACSVPETGEFTLFGGLTCGVLALISHRQRVRV